MDDLKIVALVICMFSRELRAWYLVMYKARRDSKRPNPPSE